jgi:monoamine oxidase
VRSIRNTSDGVEVVHGANIVEQADFCISTMAPIQLIAAQRNFSTNFTNRLAAIAYMPATKVGWQMRSRFWETEDRIFGGISWIKDRITQIWYPSSGYQSRYGVLTATYNDGESATESGRLPLEKRFEEALRGGEKLHPGQYVQNVMMETALGVAWQNMPHFIGGWPNETWQTDPRAYDALAGEPFDGRTYLAGDFLSYWPGWQQGALDAAEFAFKQIGERIVAG